MARVRVPCGHRYSQSISASHGDRLGHRRAMGPLTPLPRAVRAAVSSSQPFLGGSAGHPGMNAHGIGRGGRRSSGPPNPTLHVPRPWAVGVRYGVKQPRDADIGRATACATHWSWLGHHVRVAGMGCSATPEAWPPVTRLVCILRQNHTLVFSLHHLPVM
jgi:hypothetical protein